MRFSLRTKSSISGMIAGLAGVLGFQIFYFFLVIPPSKIAILNLFWTSFVMWGVFGFLMFLRSIADNRKLRQGFLLFGLVLLALLVVAPYQNLFYIPAFAFPGYYAGIGLWILATLIRRLAEL